MRTLVALLILALALAAAPVRSGEEAEGTKIVVHDRIDAWVGMGAFPIIIDVSSELGAELDITIRTRQDSFSITRRVVIPPGSLSRLEMTAPASDCMVDIGGSVPKKRVGIHFREYSENRYDRSPVLAPLACVNSFMMREINDVDTSMMAAGPSFRSLAMDDIPGRWQSFAGFVGMMVMDAGEVNSLRTGQREAITRWVRWFGGRLWLAGPKAEEAARTLGLADNIPQESDAVRGGVSRHRIGNGIVFIQEAPDADFLVANIPDIKSLNVVEPMFGRNYHYYSPGESPGAELLKSLGGMSTTIIIVCLILLGLVMGPLNYWFIRRRRNSLLFFVTTPVIALTGAAFIVGGTFVSEGFGSGYNQFAVLAHDPASGEAMLFDLRGIRSGFFAPTPRYSAESLILPIRNYGENTERIMDTTDGVALTGGWLKPRFPSGYMVAQPVVSRMNVSLQEEGGRWFAVNDLGFGVKVVAAVLPDGGYGWAEDIAPGSRKELRRTNDGGKLRSLYRRVRKLTNDKPAFSGVSLVADCEGLPYIEDGGLNSQRLEGEFLYAVVAAPEGIGP